MYEARPMYEAVLCMRPHCGSHWAAAYEAALWNEYA
jgi:hypothetical protein